MYVDGCSCSPTNSVRELLRKRQRGDKYNWNRSGYDVHVVEVRENVKLPNHRLERWVPHYPWSLSVGGTSVSHAGPARHDESKTITERTGYRCCDTPYKMEILMAQTVGGITDCHTIII